MHKKHLGGTALAIAFLSNTATAYDLVLPGEGVYPFSLDYGDFTSYSLPALNFYAHDSTGSITLDPTNSFAINPGSYGTSPQPNEPGYINSSPGELGKDGRYIVIATGSNNGGVNQNCDIDPLSDCHRLNPAQSVDDAYRTPDGGSKDTLSFDTASTSTVFNPQSLLDPAVADTLTGVSDPSYTGASEGSGEFVGDLENSWDISVATLKGFLTDETTNELEPLAVFFNHNELNKDTNQSEPAEEGAQALRAWAKVWFTNPDNYTNPADIVDPVDITPWTGRDDDYLNLSSFNLLIDQLAANGLLDAYAALLPGGSSSSWFDHVGKTPFYAQYTPTDPNIDPPAAVLTDWVLAPGSLCFKLDPTVDVIGKDGLTYAGAYLDPGCNVLDAGGPNVESLDHNLGADNAAYVLTSAVLNEILESIDESYVMHVDLKLWGEDNGYEQAFISTVSRVTTSEASEPATLALIGFGLALCGVRLRVRDGRRVEVSQTA